MWAFVHNCAFYNITFVNLYVPVEQYYSIASSALEVFFKNDMRYINSRFTYLLTFPTQLFPAKLGGFETLCVGNFGSCDFLDNFQTYEWILAGNSASVSLN